MWVLIIVLHGWGAGIGSIGNAIAAQEFSTKERCAIAAKAALSMAQPDAIGAVCVEK